MTVLILGGVQAHGPGLPAGKGYMAQFVRRLKPAHVDFYPVSMAGALHLLPRLHLLDYDLILIYVDPPMAWLPSSLPQRLLTRLRLRLHGQRLPALQHLRDQFAQVLLQVRVQNRQVVVISPLPRRRPLEQELIRQTKRVYQRTCREWAVPFFNVDQCLSGGDELFQTGSSKRLSAVAHELLASELHTFVTEPAYTV